MTSWREYRLIDVASRIHRGTAPAYSEAGSVRVIGQRVNQPYGLDWTNARLHESAERPEFLKGFLRAGDLLINSTGTGTVGRIGQYNGDSSNSICIADSHITIVRPRPTIVDSRFLYHLLRGRNIQHRMMSEYVLGATNQVELATDELKSLRLRLPSIEEQRRIAGYLDEQSSAVQQVVEARNATVRLAAERELCRISDVFSNASSGKLVALKWILRAKPTYGVLVPEFVDDGVPMVRISDIRGLAEGVPAFAEISREQARQYSRTCVEVGDVLLSVVGTVGEAVVATQKIAGANVSRAISVIRTSSGVSPILLKSWFRGFEFKRQSDLATASDSAQSALGMEDLANMLVRWPTSPAESQLMVDQVCGVENETRKMRNCLESYSRLVEERFESLSTALVSGSVHWPAERNAL